MGTATGSGVNAGTHGAPGGSAQWAGYRHEAFLYAGLEDFMGSVVPFVAAALDADVAILVVLSAQKIAALRESLNGGADRVRFADMEELGTNPARIIPAWHEFVKEQAGTGRRLRGIGEPIWAGRSAAELDECQRHEALLNIAFTDLGVAASDPGFWLLCPYDTELGAEVIDEARRNHQFVTAGGVSDRSLAFAGAEKLARPFDKPLSDPPAGSVVLEFDFGNLGELRALAGAGTRDAGLVGARASEFVLAVHEIATNSLIHGGGRGSLTLWATADSVVCEIRDAGIIDDPLAGRRAPGFLDEGGRGLWLANQLCELVQIRAMPETVVRLHARTR